MFYTPMGDMKIPLYELLNMYTIIEDHYKWPYMLSIIPLSYKLSMGVLFVYVLKRTSEAFCIRQGQHRIRSPLYVCL